MELPLEDKQELSLLSGYFKKLEISANHLGIDLDDYISEFRDNGYAQAAQKKAVATASERKKAFQKATAKEEEKAKKAASR